MNFGKKVREYRLSKNLSLRKFCEKFNQDICDWSLLERGITPPSYFKNKLEEIFNIFQLTEDQKQELMDLSNSDQRPENEDIMKNLPILFQPSGKKLTKEQLLKFIEIIKKNNLPRKSN